MGMSDGNVRWQCPMEMFDGNVRWLHLGKDDRKQIRAGNHSLAAREGCKHMAHSVMARIVMAEIVKAYVVMALQHEKAANIWPIQLWPV